MYKFVYALQLLGRTFLFPFVLSWMLLSHLFPALGKLWNPMPIQVVWCSRYPQHQTDRPHGTIVAYDLQAYHQAVGTTVSEMALVHAKEECQYIFRVDRPELLQNPKPVTLKRIARYFEGFGLKVEEVHVQQGYNNIIYRV